MHTYIAWTPPQMEWTLANKLRAVADDVVMPLEWVRVEPRDARKGTKTLNEVCAKARPLYRRYLFVKFASPTPPLAELARVHGLQWLGVNGQPYTLNPVQTLMLRTVTPTFPDKLRRLGASRFKPGQKVRAVDGPFAGQILTVEHDSGKHHVEVLGQLFGRLTPIKYNSAQLRAA
jgi:transcription antitermination factor NusG